MTPEVEPILRTSPVRGIDTTSQSQADSLVEWLEREIGSVVTPLLDRPDFRKRVRWPIERLTGERMARPINNATLILSKRSTFSYASAYG